MIHAKCCAFLRFILFKYANWLIVSFSFSFSLLSHNLVGLASECVCDSHFVPSLQFGLIIIIYLLRTVYTRRNSSHLAYILLVNLLSSIFACIDIIICALNFLFLSYAYKEINGLNLCSFAHALATLTINVRIIFYQLVWLTIL